MFKIVENDFCGKDVPVCSGAVYADELAVESALPEIDVPDFLLEFDAGLVDVALAFEVGGVAAEGVALSPENPARYPPWKSVICLFRR